MSADAWFRFLLLLAILYFAARLAFALWRGRVRGGDEQYVRGEGPPGYWRELAIDLFVLVILALGLLIPPPGEAGPGPTYGAFVGLLALAPGLARVLSTGRIPFGNEGLGYWRADRPGAYWAIVLADAALCVAALAMLVAEIA